MTQALLLGVGSGVLHAVTAPDHVLSLGPDALQRARGSWKVGFIWGVGHGLGTWLLALPALTLNNALPLELLDRYGLRVSGLVLLLTGLLAAWSLSHSHQHSGTDSRKPLLVGLMHGLTGASSLLLVLPIIVTSSIALSLTFLFAFGVAGALAMALLTLALSQLGKRLPAVALLRAQQLMTLGAIALGSVWLLGA